MKTSVEFRSTAFPRYPDEDEETVNEACWGKRLAEWVRDTLPAQGCATADILCEDWGWLVNLKHDEFPLWIGCAVVEEGDPDHEFRAFVTAEPRFMQRLFKKIDTKPTLEKTASALFAILAAHPETTGLRWEEDGSSLTDH